jgi:hypothetical protein
MSHPSQVISGARRRAAEETIRQAADVWASGHRELQPTVVLSVFLHCLSSDVNFEPFPPGHGSTTPGISNPLGNLPLRPLEAWQTVARTPEEELRKLEPSLSHAKAVENCSVLLAIIEGACEKWLIGNPEQPSTDLITVTLARYLYDEHLISAWHSAGMRP